MNRMMVFPLVAFLIFCGLDSFSQSKAKASKEASLLEDSVVYYEVEIEGRQKNYKELLTGSWFIDTMRRQARAVPDVLNNVQINLNTDQTFTGKTGCADISGTYRLKGTSIKFMNISNAKTNCEPSEQERALQKLLTQTVSTYTVENDILLLRDGSSNVVFRAGRKKAN